jgi:serine/threonine-protein kinase RsbW
MPMSARDDDQQTVIDEVVTLGTLGELRAQVLRLAARAGLPEQRAEAFALAVHEAVANTIRHAGGTGEVAVVQDDDRKLIAEVCDHGPGIAGSVTVGMPPTDAVGGRGMSLVNVLADHVEVRSGPGGTTVRLEMSLPSP